MIYQKMKKQMRSRSERKRKEKRQTFKKLYEQHQQ